MQKSSAIDEVLLSVHHIEFYVSNALQVVFVFTTCKEKDEDFVRHLSIHGDSVKDVAFAVDDVRITVKHIIKANGFILKSTGTTTNYMDCGGDFIECAVVALPDSDICHTLLNPRTYRGFFLPRYERYDDDNDLLKSMDDISFSSVDHIAIAIPIKSSQQFANYYNRTFGLAEIWSVDGSIVSTENSSMNVSLLANRSKTVQLVLAEPVPKQLRIRSQIEAGLKILSKEFLDYNGGTGVQHIAFLVNDIIETVEKMKRRGVQFVSIPDQYYVNLQERLSISPIKVAENFEKLKKLQILTDFDDYGYLLQIFTQPVQDRPTLFLEIIQRNNYSGFGAGNVKALFDAVEREQKMRGTLERDW